MMLLVKMNSIAASVHKQLVRVCMCMCIQCVSNARFHIIVIVINIIIDSYDIRP